MQMFNAAYMRIPAAEQWHSVGNSCQLLNVTPQMLAALMDDSGIEFLRAIDGVPLLNGEQLKILSDRYNEHVDTINQTAEAVSRAARNN